MSVSKKVVMGTVMAITLATFASGCGKSSGSASPATISGSNTQGPKAPEKLKALNLGTAEGFAILAYSNITSNPNSAINGKVGLKPGTHDMITLDPSEVKGGIQDILGSDDETDPINFLSNAKVDMVTAYTKAAGLTPDADKVNMIEAQADGKILKAGVYKWSAGLTVTKDFTLEGNTNDIWVFKIPGHMKVGSGVHMILGKGVQAKNIFWQVAGSATLEANSDFSGTIIAQQFIEIKNHATLTGRAFAKNGYVNLDQATINLP